MYKIIRLLATFGIVLACYLLYEQLSYSSWQPCNITSTINCTAIISGEVSKTFGIPTPLIGLTGYIIIFLATLWKLKKIILAMASVGLAFCLWIGYRELFQLHVICPVCILCQLDMIIVFILAIRLQKGVI